MGVGKFLVKFVSVTLSKILTKSPDHIYLLFLKVSVIFSYVVQPRKRRQSFSQQLHNEKYFSASEMTSLETLI